MIKNAPEHLRYPIGRFTEPEIITPADLEQALETLEKFPAELAALVSQLPDDQLELTYRPGGWDIRQIVHHLADSHANAFIRIRFALTLDNPVIMPYPEQLWSELPDNRLMPVQPSLDFLAGLHARMVFLLRSLSPRQWKYTYVHPEHERTFTLEVVALSYAWHSLHHLAHIRLAISNLRQN